MFEIHECTDGALLQKYSERFGADYTSGDRGFVFYENGPKGIGILGLDKGTVLLKTVTDCGSAEYAEVLLRAVLNVILDFAPIRVVRRGADESLTRFGFTEKDGNMVAVSNQIRLCCH